MLCSHLCLTTLSLQWRTAHYTRTRRCEWWQVSTIKMLRKIYIATIGSQAWRLWTSALHLTLTATGLVVSVIIVEIWKCFFFIILIILHFKASNFQCHHQLPVYCIETAPYTLPPPPSASIGDCRVMFVTTAQVQGDFSGQLQIGQYAPAFIEADKVCEAAFQTDGNDIVKSRASVGYSVWLSAGVCWFFVCFFISIFFTSTHS